MDYQALSDRLSIPDGGFTVRLDGTHVMAGYAVSVYPELEYVLETPVMAGQIRRYINGVRPGHQDGDVLGGWHNPDNGKVYLDVSRVVATAEEAESLCREFGQIGFYDFANGRSVPVTD